MTSRRNVLLDYLGGALTIEELRAYVGSSRDPSAGELLRLAEFDGRCRRILSEVEPSPGAPERLKELVLTAPIDDASSRAPTTSPFWQTAGRALAFDVLGAQRTAKEIPGEKRRSRGRKLTGKGRNRSSKKNH